ETQRDVPQNVSTGKTTIVDDASSQRWLAKPSSEAFNIKPASTRAQEASVAPQTTSLNNTTPLMVEIVDAGEVQSSFDTASTHRSAASPLSVLTHSSCNSCLGSS
uniref:Uncharacterized protein n=1 Tax=Mesocestoides corti TaxID=53468 RepID=A0A5K3FF49_MESCO